MNKIYFDVVIENNHQYRMIETYSKQTDHQALATLKKIKHIIKHNLSLDQSWESNYLKKTPEQALRILKQKAQEITQKYCDKVDKSQGIFQSFLKNKKQEVLDQNERIIQLLSPSPFNELPLELTQSIADFLDLESLKQFQAMNPTIRDQLGVCFLQKAKKYGYIAKDEKEAKNYLNQLEQQINKIFNLLNLSLKKSSLDDKIETIKKLPDEQLLSLFVQDDFYKEDFTLIRNYLVRATSLTNLAEQFHLLKDKALYASVEHQNLTVAEFLLQSGANPNAMIGQVTHLPTPFIYAIIEQNLAMIELLLKYEANVNELIDGIPPLAFACGYNSSNSPPSVEIIQLLFEKGAQANVIIHQGNPLIIFACGYENKHELTNPQILQLFLNYGADPGAMANNQNSLLHLIAQRGNLTCLKILFDQFKALGQDPQINRRGDEGATPLIYACRSKNFSKKINLPMIDFLLDHGADPNLGTFQGVFPLHLASCSGEAEVVERLLTNPSVKADPNIVQEPGDTPLGLMSFPNNLVKYKFNLQVAELLLRHGADPNRRTTQRSNPLHLAAQKGLTSYIELLLEYQADIHALSETGATPLFFALNSENRGIYRPSKETLETLLLHGANLNACLNGQPLLHQAVQTANLELFKILLNFEVTINQVNQDGQTALHVACGMSENLPDLNKKIYALLSKGIDVHLEDQEGNQALHLAAKSFNPQAVLLLLSLQADPNAKNHQGETPLDLSHGNFNLSTSGPEACNRCLEVRKMISDHGGNTTLEGLRKRLRHKNL